MFKLQADYQHAGDQPQAIVRLTEILSRSEQQINQPANGGRQTNCQPANGGRQAVLLGVTGSGKTFTAANVIQNLQKPTLVIAHNKTLAAQLYSEFREFFPDNAVEYFVSYYDYYQPEAYLPATDTYIEKDASINQEIDRLRHSATKALMTRKDVIVVASVSCIYGLGLPEEYFNTVFYLKRGLPVSRDAVIKRLVAMYYERKAISQSKTAGILLDLLRDLRVVLVGPIRQELLSGISSPALFRKLKEKLSGLHDFPLDTAVYELAAEYANTCRQHGVQGSHTDFLICAAAAQNGWAIFTADKDFQNYQKYLPLKLFTPAG